MYLCDDYLDENQFTSLLKQKLLKFVVKGNNQQNQYY